MLVCAANVDSQVGLHQRPQEGRAVGKKRFDVETFKAPWEVDAEGADIPEDEQEIDTGRLKKYLVGLLNDKEQAVEARDAAQLELSQAQGKLEEKSRKDETDDERVQRDAEARAQEKREAAEAKRDALALRIALKQKGISGEDAVDLADVLKGDTEEELTAHAERLAPRFVTAKAPADDDEDEEQQTPGTRPRPLRTPGDPKPHTKAELSFEEQLAQVRRPGGSQY